MAEALRTALVTGSGQNIGRGIALRLAQVGFNIVVNGSSNRDACEAVAADIVAAGGNAMVAMGDIGNKLDTVDIVQAASNAFGAVDVLINNAAIRPNCHFLEVSEADWERVMNVNYKSAFWLARLCLPTMIERKWGRIINFTGMNAQLGYAGKAAVTVSKHATWGLTKALAKEFGVAGVTTNIIAPGTIEPDADDPTDKRDFAALRLSNPSGRLGTVADIANLIELLVSDRGGFINGQMLQVNGGTVCQF